ncbi:MAG: hypothetical protein XD88_1405 [Methanocalculus sp. 52_23]|nr:MAG: hypothetical protein XD88_1405 [Methanocalculus sp. 52_23]
MKIESGRIRSYHASPDCVAGSLSPDNTDTMEMHISQDYVEMVIRDMPLRSAIATIDDYLMNLSIADSLCSERMKKMEQEQA